MHKMETNIYDMCNIMINTRMHSSRMRTGRSLTVCGVCFSGGLFLGGCLLPGGVSALGGCLLPGGMCIPACTEADTPLLTESQTPVKTLPWPNFVVAGNKNSFQYCVGCVPPTSVDATRCQYQGAMMSLPIWSHVLS